MPESLSRSALLVIAMQCDFCSTGGDAARLSSVTSNIRLMLCGAPTEVCVQSTLGEAA